MNTKKNVILVVLFVIVIVVCSCFVLGGCGSSRSNSSGKKWSDLTEQEKENARWAYHAKQAAEEYKKNH